MVDSLITVQIKLENLGLGGAGGGGGGGTGGGGGGGGTASLNLEDLRRAFSDLATDIRSISTSLSELSRATAAFREASAAATAAQTTAAGQQPGGGTASRETADADREATRASEQAAAASKEKAQATKQEAEATEEATQRLRTAAEAEAAYAASVGVTSETVAELQRRSQALALANGNAATAADLLSRKTEETAGVTGRLADRLSGGTQSSVGKFLQNIIPVRENEAFRRRAAQLTENTRQLFRFDPNRLTDDARRRLDEAFNAVGGQIRSAVERLDSDIGNIDTTEILNALRNNIQRTLDRFDLRGVSFNFRELQESFRGREFTSESNLAQELLRQIDVARQSGAPEQEVNVLIQKFDAVIARIENLVSAETAGGRRGNTGTFLPPSLTGRGREDLQTGLNAVIPPGATRRRLSPLQQEIVQTITQLNRASQPLEVVRNAFRLLTRDTNNLEENVRQIRGALQGFNQSAAGGIESFERLQEVIRLINVRRDRTGRIQAPTTADPVASRVFTAERVNRFRQEAGQTLGRGQRAERLFSAVDATGNLRRIRVEVRRLNDDLGTLRVRAEQVSDNLFDRASVRTALARVATWGAAAGIVFGAVNAFRNAVDIVVSTESAVISLAKVMEESRVDFDAFARTARDTAVAIAQDFGQPLEQVLETMITFGQQGLSFPEVQNLTEAAALAAVVTTLDQTQAASALTAATQQFGVETSQATTIVDKFNNVANNAAVTEDVLAEALKRAGIAARNAGVDLDQFNGIVAAISEQTRQSGSEIGTALRFIFSRLNTNEAEAGLARVGVSLRDAEGNIRPFVDVITNLRERFDELSSSQQTQAAIAVAGTRRFNTFLALLQNFDRFTESAANSVNSAGSALEELSNVEEGAEFRFQQLKNSLAGAAISFGDVFLGPVKAATDGLTVFFDVLSNIPSGIQALTLLLGGATVAFAKFSDFFVQVSDVTLGGAGGGGGIFRSIAQSFTQGTSGVGDIADNILEEAAKQRRASGGLGTEGTAVLTTAAAQTVGDFSRFARGADAAEDFSTALAKANLTLLDSEGKALRAGASVTKFQATVRGFRTVDTDAFRTLGDGAATAALSVGGLNNPFSRVLALLVRLANVVPGVNFGFNLLEKQADKIGGTFSRNARLVGAFGRVLVAGLAINFAIGQLQDFVAAATRTGQDIEESLRPEIARRQEAISALREQRSEIERLSDAQDRLSRASIRSDITQADAPALRREQIRRREFESPILQQRELNQARQEAANQIGFANPQLIESIDELGNVVLRSAAAFDELAESAITAEERLLALTQLQVAEGFARDVLPADSLAQRAAQFIGTFTDTITFGLTDLSETFGKTIRDRLDDSLIDVRQFAQDSRNEVAANLGVDVNVIDAGFAERQGRAFQRLSGVTAEYEVALGRVQEVIRQFPENTAAIIFQNKAIVQATNDLARAQSQLEGDRVTGAQVRAQLVLQNAGGIPEQVRNTIQARPFDTREALNEAGFIDQAIRVGELTADQLRTTLRDRLREGDVVIFEGLFGERQGQVSINEFGERIVTVLDEAGQDLERIRLADLIETQGVEEIFQFIPDQIEDQINRALLEVNRLATGGGRGIILGQDIDIGAARRFDVSAQQRASLLDENLFRDVIQAQRALSDIREVTLGTGGEEGAVAGAITSDVLNNVRQLADAFDRLATIVRYREAIESVNLSFARAVDEIRRNNIAEEIRSQFATAGGALAAPGAAPQFELPLLERELNAQQLFQRDNQDLIRAGNSILASQEALVEAAVGFGQSERNIREIFAEFSAARGAGGVLDTGRLSQLAESSLAGVRGGLDEGTALQVSLAREELSVSEQQLRQLQIIANQESGGLSSRDLGSRLASVARDSAAPATLDRIANRLANVTAEELRSFNQRDLETLVQNLGPRAPEAAVEEFAARRAGTAAAGVNQRLLNFTTEQTNRSIREILETVLPEQFTPRDPAGAREEATAQARALLDAARTAGGGIFGGQAEAIPQQRLEAVLENFLTNLEATPQTREQAQEIRRAISEGELPRILEDLRSAVNSVSRSLEEVTPNAPEAPGRSLEEETNAAEARARALRDSLVANQEVTRADRELVFAFTRLQREVLDAAVAVRDNLTEAINNINLAEQLGSLLSQEISGVLAGTIAPEFQTGARREDLTGTQLTQLENQNLVTSANALVQARTSLLSALQGNITGTGNVRDIRQQALDRGDVDSVQAADAVLEQLGNTAALLTSQTEGSTDALRRLSESFERLERVNQLRQDIDRLFQSLDRELKLDFDTTSIDSALGQNLFSLVRPTFEQFEQGQRGFATAFERAIEDINFRRRAGQISPQEARREEQRATFQRDEGIIELAQQRENRRLQSEVDTARQIRERLFDFSTAGGPGAGQAQRLIDQLTRGLEGAGDVIRTNVGSRSIRNPLTGREERVPASQILAFRGIPGLQRIQQQVQALGQQAQAQEAARNASLISDPITEELRRGREQAAEDARAVQELLRQDEAAQRAAERVDVATALQSGFNDLLSAREGGTDPNVATDNERAFAQFRETVSAAVRDSSKDVVREVIGELQVVDEEGTQTGLLDVIRSIGEGEGVSDQLGESVREFLNTFGESSTEAGEALQFISVTGNNVAETFSTVAENVGALAGPTEGLTTNFQELLTTAEELVGSFRELSNAQTPFSDAVNRIIQGGNIQARAGGGLITGPGGPREDRVPILASPGEFVINAAAVNRIGLDNLNNLNSVGGLGGTGQGSFSLGGLIQRFQTGGLVRLVDGRLASGPFGGEEGFIGPPSEDDLDRLQREEEERRRREARENRLRQLQAEGYRFAPDEDGTNFGVTAPGLDFRRDILTDRERRREFDAAGGFAGGLRSLRGATARGVPVNQRGGAQFDIEDGRLVFRRGGRFDQTELARAGLSASDDAGEIFETLTRRRAEVRQRITSAQDEQRSKQQEVLELTAQKEEEQKAAEHLGSFTKALAFIQAKLSSNATEKLPGAFRQVEEFSNAFDTLSDPDKLNELAQEEFNVLSNIFKRAADELEPLAISLSNSTAQSLLLAPPPSLQEKDTGIFYRGTPRSRVGLQRTLDGNYEPFIEGFAVSSIPPIEQLAKTLNPDLISTLRSASEQALAQKGFGAAGARGNLVRDLANAVEEGKQFIADELDLGSTGQGVLDVVFAPATASTGVIAGLTEGAISVADLALGNLDANEFANLATEAVIQPFRELAGSGDTFQEIANLEAALDSSRDPAERARIRRQIQNVRTGYGINAGYAAGAFAGGARGVRSFASRARGRGAFVANRNATLRQALLGDVELTDPRVSAAFRNVSSAGFNRIKDVGRLVADSRVGNAIGGFVEKGTDLAKEKGKNVVRAAKDRISRKLAEIGDDSGGADVRRGFLSRRRRSSADPDSPTTSAEKISAEAKAAEQTARAVDDIITEAKKGDIGLDERLGDVVDSTPEAVIDANRSFFSRILSRLSDRSTRTGRFLTGARPLRDIGGRLATTGALGLGATLATGAGLAPAAVITAIGSLGAAVGPALIRALRSGVSRRFFGGFRNIIGAGANRLGSAFTRRSRFRELRNALPENAGAQLESLLRGEGGGLDIEGFTPTTGFEFGQTPRDILGLTPDRLGAGLTADVGRLPLANLLADVNTGSRRLLPEQIRPSAITAAGEITAGVPDTGPAVGGPSVQLERGLANRVVAENTLRNLRQRRAALDVVEQLLEEEGQVASAAGSIEARTLASPDIEAGGVSLGRDALQDIQTAELNRAIRDTFRGQSPEAVRTLLQEAGVPESALGRLVGEGPESRAFFRDEVFRAVAARRDEAGFIREQVRRRGERGAFGDEAVLQDLAANREAARRVLAIQRAVDAGDFDILARDAIPAQERPLAVLRGAEAGVADIAAGRAGLARFIDAELGAGSFQRLRQAGVEFGEGTISDFLRFGDNQELTSSILSTARDELRRLEVGGDVFLSERIARVQDIRRRAGVGAPPRSVAAAGEIPAGGGRREVNPQQIVRRQEIDRARRQVFSEILGPGAFDQLRAAGVEISDSLLRDIATGNPSALQTLQNILSEAEIGNAEFIRRIVDRTESAASARRASERVALEERRTPLQRPKSGRSELDDLLSILDDTDEFAAGGFITGPGGPRSDRVPILASNGEFIVNANTVQRLGPQFFEALNGGAVPRFQDGGLVGGGTTGGTSSIEVSVNTEEITSAVSAGISAALADSSVTLNAETAAEVVSTAVSTALSNAILPAVEVNTEGVSIPVEIPDGGIPIDATALQNLDLGNNLGSAIRNRLESVEGSVGNLREDTNELIETVSSLDVESFNGLTTEVENIKNDIVPLSSRIDSVELQISTQKDEILTEVFTLVNEQINNIQFGDDTATRLQTHISQTDSRFNSISNRISEAIDLANQAFTRSLTRN